MQGEPLVSIIINCYNCEKYLREAIDSVYAQTYRNWEIVFWDNGSTDTSAQIAKSYDDRLLYFRGAETVSLGAARNLAVEKARGEFIAFLDSDDTWMAQKLEKQMPLFQDYEVGLVYCDIEKFNDRGDTLKVSRLIPFLSGWCFGDLLTSYFLYPTNVVIRKQALAQEDVIFDERFTYSEDFDLFARIAYNWKLDFVDEVLARYRVHAANLTSNIADEAGFTELEEIIAKFRLKDPGFDTKYENAVKRVEMIIANNRAYFLWKNKKSGDARTILQPYFLRYKISTLIYLCTFLPFFNLKKLRKQFLDITPGS